MRLLATVLATLVLAAGCARPTPAQPLAGSGSGSGSATPTVAASDRTTAIHIEVLRRYLTSPSENSNLGGKVIYILDHTDASAGDPMTSGGSPGEPMSAAARQAIAEALQGIAPVRFVATREEAMTNQDNCAVVRDNGILMVLGPPKSSGSAYHVPVHGFVACLGATWLTYVVEPSGAGWAVTGTTGSMAVA